MNLSNIKKNHKYIFIGIIAMVVILIIVLIASILQDKTISYTAAEKKMKEAGIEYFEENDLPADSKTVSVSLETLVNETRIKPFSELIEDDSCTGAVYVTNNNGNYLYTTQLNCGSNYKTKLLSEQIKNDNTLNEDDSLYELDNDLVFRGEKVNNYISFSGNIWKITKINSDNSIELILNEIGKDKYKWDDRYNVERRSSVGINDYEVSRMKDTLTDYYNSLSSVAKSFVIPTDICIDKVLSDTVSATECKNTINSYISLLELKQYSQASLDENCKYITDEACANYNYMSFFSSSFWTITADAANTYKIFKISERPASYTASTTSILRPVLTITNKAVYTSGNGTESDPYKI